jgi:hypothetical protein
MTKSKKPPLKKEPGRESPFASLSPTTQDLLCVAFLYIITLVLFRGIVFENAAFASEGDTAAALSYAHAGDAIKATEGVDVLWMPFFFSGMPTFGNVAYVPHDVNYLQSIAVKALNIFYLNGKWTWLVVFYFLGGVFMFLLVRVLKFSRGAALFAALTFMLSPYAIGLAAEGHGTKLMALSYIPAVFLLTHHLLERRDLLSFGLAAAAIGTLLLTNHMQIAYYACIVIGLYLLYQVILDVKEDKLLAGKKVALFVGALFLGLCISSYIYLSVYEYAQYSIRGGGTTGAPGGLTYDYATNWSWNPWEFFTLLVPSFFGFQSPYYWGTMPFTNSTVYVGVLPVLLSVIALVYRRNKMTIFFGILTVIVFLMSFGKHFSIFYQILFNYLPFFNKFRAPAMILHLLAFTLAALGAYGFSFLLEARDRAREFNLEKLKKVLLYTLGGLGGVLILGFLLQSSIADTLSGFMFLKEGEAQQFRQQYAQQAPQAIAQIKQIRFDMLWKDFVKFVLLAGASIGIILAYLNNKIQAVVFSASIIGILLVDLFIMDVKFIDPKPASAIEQNFLPDATIKFLKEQPGLFRIFPVGQLFMDNTYAYHGLQSIGGYSPAKLKIYQTMIDSCLYQGADPAFPLNMNIVKMLNVRYLVAQGQLPSDRFDLVSTDEGKRTLTYENPHPLPRAFFVKKVVVAHNDSETFAALNAVSFDVSSMAVVEKPLPQELTPTDGAAAEVIEYTSRKIVVKASTSSPALLVLSEVYYPAGWRAFLDGKETEIFRTNYILRSVLVPSGQHEIVFSFEPAMYGLGWVLSRGSWFVAWLCILVGLWSLPSVRGRLARKRPEQRTSEG